MSETRRPDDPERDAWLSQALRHAPDAGSDAPPALSDAILREARAAVAPPEVASRERARGGAGNAFVAFWGWLARPPVAAGFASVMVATLVGLLWWDRPLEETLPRAQAPVAASSAAEAAPVTVPEAKSADRVASLEKDERSAAAKAVPLVARPVARAPAPTDEAALKRVDRAAAPETVPDPEPAPAPGAAGPAAPAAVAAAAPPSPEARRREASGAAAEAPGRMLTEAAADKAAPAQGELRALQGNGAPLAKASVADTAGTPLAGLLSGIAAQPERWRWQRGTGEAQAMTPALQRWLVQLDRSTTSRWRTAPEAAARETQAALRLLRDGVPVATLALSGSGVSIETPGTAPAPAVSTAALPRASVESLRQALDEAAP